MTGEQTTGTENVALLDLRHMSSADVAHIHYIKNVATVLVPESLMSAVSAIPIENVAVVIPVPEGVPVRAHTGTVTMGGDALAHAGEDEVLLVTGSLLLTSPVTRVAYGQVIVTGMVLAPRGSESTLGAGLTRVTGSVQYYTYAEGQEIKTLSGQSLLSGEVLANPEGTPEDVLILSGQHLVTSPVPALGYQRIFVQGQLVAPRETEQVLWPALVTSGQVAWYSGQPRFFLGDEVLGKTFFELLDDPIALALIGHFEIEPDVPPELLKDKVSDITLVGRVTAPKQVVPVLQLLATEKHGEISVREDDPEHG